MTAVACRACPAPRAEAQFRGRLHRASPDCPRGARGGPQAPRHVHRLHRRPRADALPVGDHRQLGRRGSGRALHPHRGHPARRRLGRGPRQRPRDPGRHRAEDRADRRRGRDDQAARGRQVRRRLLHRVGRPARRGRLGGQRPVRPAGRRGRPGRAASGRPASAAACPASSRGRPGRLVPAPGTGLRKVRQGGQDADRHQDPVLAGPADLRARRGLELRCRWPSGPGRPRTWCPGSSHQRSVDRAATGRAGPQTGDRDGGRAPGAARSSGSTAASASSAPTWHRASRSPTCCGCAAPGSSPRPCRCWTTRAT